MIIKNVPSKITFLERIKEIDVLKEDQKENAVIKVFTDFIQPIPSTNTDKIKLFKILIEKNLISPNTKLPILIGNEDPLIGVLPQEDRPLEFIVGQLLNSKCKDEWISLIKDLVKDKAWKNSFTRLLVFKQLIIVDGSTKAEVPFIAFKEIPSYISLYLKQEGKGPGQDQEKLNNLAKYIETELLLNKNQDYRSCILNFNIFGGLVHSNIKTLLSKAKKPIF